MKTSAEDTEQKLKNVALGFALLQPVSDELI